MSIDGCILMKEGFLSFMISEDCKSRSVNSSDAERR